MPLRGLALGTHTFYAVKNWINKKEEKKLTEVFLLFFYS